MTQFDAPTRQNSLPETVPGVVSRNDISDGKFFEFYNTFREYLPIRLADFENV